MRSERETQVYRKPNNLPTIFYKCSCLIPNQIPRAQSVPTRTPSTPSTLSGSKITSILLSNFLLVVREIIIFDRSAIGNPLRPPLRAHRPRHRLMLCWIVAAAARAIDGRRAPAPWSRANGGRHERYARYRLRRPFQDVVPVHPPRHHRRRRNRIRSGLDGDHVALSRKR